MGNPRDKHMGHKGEVVLVYLVAETTSVVLCTSVTGVHALRYGVRTTGSGCIRRRSSTVLRSLTSRETQVYLKGASLARTAVARV
jgi:hypothetical protein